MSSGIISAVDFAINQKFSSRIIETQRRRLMYFYVVNGTRAKFRARRSVEGKCPGSVNKYGRIGFLYIFAWGKSATSENKRSDNARFLPEVTMDLCFNLKLKFQFRCPRIARNNDTLQPRGVVLSTCKANRTQSLSLGIGILYFERNLLYYRFDNKLNK